KFSIEFHLAIISRAFMIPHARGGAPVLTCGHLMPFALASQENQDSGGTGTESRILSSGFHLNAHGRIRVPESPHRRSAMNFRKCALLLMAIMLALAGAAQAQ